MRTLKYVGRGWWSQVATKFKKTEDAIKVYGKDNVARIGPGVWLCTENSVGSNNGTPLELLIMECEQNPKAKTKVNTKVKSTEKAGTRTKKSLKPKPPIPGTDPDHQKRGVKMAYDTDCKSGGRERSPAGPNQRKPPRASR